MIKHIIVAMIACSLSSCLIPFPRILKTPIPSLSGSVIDKHTKRPISGANVQFRNQSETAVVTNRDGKFNTQKSSNIQFTILDSFYISQDLTLDVKAFGYKDSSISLTRYGRLGGWQYSNMSPKIELSLKQVEQDSAHQSTTRSESKLK